MAHATPAPHGSPDEARAIGQGAAIREGRTQRALRNLALDLNLVGVTEVIMLTSDLIVPGPFADASAEPGSAGEGMPHAERTRAAGPGAADLRSAGESDAADRQAALRALRNLEATEARLVRNASREAEDARGKLVQELLPVLDNLERTLHAAQVNRGDPAMFEGVRMVRQQLEGVLRGYGVERVDAVGQRFDPGLHEAIGVTAVAEPSRHGVVVYQAEPGYRFAGRLLRPAKVTVGKLATPAYAAPRPLW
jgi:molecular chaperone GrpE